MLIIEYQIMIDCIIFLIKHFKFEYNQTYHTFYIYNENKNYIYNRIYTEN